MTALLLALLAAAPVTAPQRAARVQELQADLDKLDRSIEETERLIARSRPARYLADLQLRLCELYVEKSRTLYHLQAEGRPDGEQGPLVSPETRLLKEKAAALYARLLREHPRFKDADKVRFYLAHEQRELGLFPQMLKTLGELVRLHPRSPLRLEAEQILGDHAFDAQDLARAEKHYRAVLKAPESPVHDLARYKLGWIRVNQLDHAGAVAWFEAVARSRPAAGADAKKSLDLKREALTDLVYSYTEVKPAKGALAYFERLSDSRATYALVLEKLASRYAARSESWSAAMALRALLEVQPDAELDAERATALYDALRESKDKALPRAQDVRFLVRAAASVRVGLKRTPEARAAQLASLEEMARDLSTRVHLAAQKKGDARLHSEAADAYAEYLRLFRPSRHVKDVLENRADALFAARRFHASARAFEELALALEGENPEGQQRALYGSLVSWQAASKVEATDARTHLQAVESRQALKLLGASYLRRFPGDAHATEVAFNVARAHFDDGEFRRSGELFQAFALAHPDHKDAAAAGHLALDSWRQAGDFRRLEATGQALAKADGLPEGFKREVAQVLAQARGEAFADLALASAQRTGDVVAGLVQVAEESSDAALQARALQGALAAAREKGDYEKEQALARRLLAEHPDAPQAKALALDLARRSAEVARFGEAAAWYTEAAQAATGQAARDAWQSAASLRLALGDVEGGAAALEEAAKLAQGREKAELLAEVAEEWLARGDAGPARSAARRAIASDGSNARAAAVLAEADPDGAEDLAETLLGAEGEAAAKGLWFLAEAKWKAFDALGADEVEAKVAALQELEALYAKVAQQGSPDWAVAALWRLGLAYQGLVGAVKDATKPPPELTAAEVRQFRAAVKEQTAPLEARADEAFGACVQRAEQLEVYTLAAAGCRARSARPDVELVKAPAEARAQVPQALQAAVDRKADARSLLELGLAWLERGSPARARLTLARAVQLEPSNARAHAALGAALLRLGETGLAADALKEAVRLDEGEARARGNLAALKCRYGDASGARAELEKVSDKSSLSGPEVDGGWRSCTDAYSRR